MPRFLSNGWRMPGGPGRFRFGFPVTDTTPVVTLVNPSAGPVEGGTAVTITGKNFRTDGAGGNIAVVFGDQLATSVVVVSPTTITCVTPALTDVGVEDVVVYCGSQYGTLFNGFTFYQPTITDVAPAYGTFAGGATVVLDGYNFDTAASYAVDLGGSAATNVTVIDSQHISITLPSHAPGFVDVELTSLDGLTLFATLRNGFQFTLLTRGDDIRRQPGITVQDSLNNSPNTCKFTVDGNSNVPVYGEKIEIRDSEDGDRLLFAGTVQTVDQIYEGQTDQLAFEATCTDFTYLFNKNRPFGVYLNVSATDVVKDLVSKYAPGFTTIRVQTKLAKVTLVLDGSMDLVTALTNIAQQIGGGHWYVDYTQDVHFFHIAPTAVLVPTNFVDLGSHMTVVEGAAIPAAFSYSKGYLFFRHTFIYSDGSETSFGPISNVFLASGLNQLSFTGIPVGPNRGSLTCTGRRIYYNQLSPTNLLASINQKIESVQGFVQINDNTTTAFTTWFGATGASVATVVAFGAVKTFPTPSVATPDGFVLLSDQAAALNLTGSVPNGTYGLLALLTPPGAGTIVGTVSSSMPDLFPGDTLTFKFVVNNNAGGSTTLGAAVVYTVVGSGIPFQLAMPRVQTPALPADDAGASLSAYVSFNGGGFFSAAGGLFPGQIFNFTGLSRAFFESGPAAPTTNTARVGIGWVGYNGAALIPSGGPYPASGGTVAYFASQNTAVLLENLASTTQNRLPSVPFTGHQAAPANGPVATVRFAQAGQDWWGDQWAQFKYAFLYRDGSVSFPSPASPSVGRQVPINGSWVAGWNVLGIAPGPAINGNDVVARLLYVNYGLPSLPSFSIGGQDGTGVFALGAAWPVPFSDPTWHPGTSNGALVVIPDNVTTELDAFNPQVPLGTQQQIPTNKLGTTFSLGDPGFAVAGGSYPVNNDGALSSDPIPIWPNPDGPSLEDLDPPGDIDDSNEDLLHGESGSQPFTLSKDISQLRNRVFVVGSGSQVIATATLGAVALYVADITAFSPSGGQVRAIDALTQVQTIVNYTGVAGVPGNAYITLATALTSPVVQGSFVNNWLQVDDIVSQQLMAKVERDKDGKPTNGVHEFTIVDGTLKAVFQLYMRGNAELELYGKPILTIKYATRDPKTKSGQIVHVDLSHPPCQGDFLIQSVTIDQIHDESDDLMPRYTVTASSVMFELNDLLLQILKSAPSTVSATGLVASASAIASSAIANQPVAAAGSVDISQLMRAVSLCAMYESSSAGNFQSLIGLTPSNGGAATSTFIDTRGVWARLTSAATVGGTAASSTSTSPTVRLDHNPTWLMHFRINDVTNVRFWAGFWGNNPTDADVSVRPGCGVRFSTVAGDTGFRLVAFDGSTQTLGGTVGSLNANTEYLLRCAVSGNGTLLTVTLVDVIAGTQTSGSLTIPAGATGQALFFGVARVMPQTTSARILDVLRWATEYGEAVVPIS